MSTIWVDSEIESVLKCPACDSDKYYLLYQSVKDFLNPTFEHSWDLFKCNDCDSAFLGRRPIEELIGRAYETYHTHLELHETKQDSKFLSKLKRFIKNSYIGIKYSNKKEHDLLNYLANSLVYLLPSLRFKIDVDHRFLPKPIGFKRLLDIGCGNGYFLREALNCGWNAFGIDFDVKAIQVGKSMGLPCDLWNASNFDANDKYFDVITLSHVIEHIYHPRDFINKVSRMLSDNGILYIDTPNINSKFSKRFQNHWRGLESPRHLVIFSVSSIVSLLTEAGLSNIKFIKRYDVNSGMRRASELISNNVECHSNESIYHRWYDDFDCFRGLQECEFITLLASRHR